MSVAWPSGLRRWFKAPVSSEAWVRIPPLPAYFCWEILQQCTFSLQVLPSADHQSQEICVKLQEHGFEHMWLMQKVIFPGTYSLTYIVVLCGRRGLCGISCYGGCIINVDPFLVLYVFYLYIQAFINYHIEHI